MKRLIPCSLLIGLCGALPACNNINSMDFPGVYKISIPQGNMITQDMVDQLRPGMTQRQVIFVMGTPLVRDPFHQDRWDYIYSFQPGGGQRGQERLTVFFVDDELVRFEGDFMPSPEALANAAAPLPEFPEFPEEPGPEATGPEASALEEPGSETTGPETLTLEAPVPEEPILEVPAPQRTIPEGPITREAIPVDASPEETGPEETEETIAPVPESLDAPAMEPAMEERSPGETIPGASNLDETEEPAEPDPGTPGTGF